MNWYYPWANNYITGRDTISGMMLEANCGFEKLKANACLNQASIMFNFQSNPMCWQMNMYDSSFKWPMPWDSENWSWNMNWNNNWQYPWGGGKAGGGGVSNLTLEEKNEQTKKEREYKALKELLLSYAAVGCDDEDMKSKIDNAVKHSGSCPKDADEDEKALKPIDRKLRALQELYNEIDKADLRKAMSNITSDKLKVRAELEKMGYNFDLSDYSFSNTSDTKGSYERKFTKIRREFEDMKKDNNNSTLVFNDLIKPMTGNENNDILNVISTWNDKCKSADEKSIIRYIAKHKDKHPTQAKEKAQVLADALTNKAIHVKNNNKSLTEKERQAIEDQMSVVNSKANGSDWAKLADEFEKLYVMLRRAEAKDMNAKISKSYKFLNNIATNDTDFIDGRIIIEDTEADLKAEGLDSVDTDEVIVTPGGGSGGSRTSTTPDADTLKNHGEPWTVTSRGVRNVSAYKYNDKFYMIRTDGNVQELKDVTDAVQNGTAPQPPVDPNPEDVELPKAEVIKTDGTKIVAKKNGKEIAPKGQKYYKYNEVIYKVDGEAVTIAPSYISE